MTPEVPDWVGIVMMIGVLGGLAYTFTLLLDALLLAVRGVRFAVRWLRAHVPVRVYDR